MVATIFTLPSIHTRLSGFMKTSRWIPPSLLGGGMASGDLGAAAPNTILPLAKPRSLLRGSLLVYNKIGRRRRVLFGSPAIQPKFFSLVLLYQSPRPEELGFGQGSLQFLPIIPPSLEHISKATHTANKTGVVGLRLDLPT